MYTLNGLINIDKHRFILTVEHEHLLTGDHFEGEFLLRSENPIFSGFVGDDGLALIPMLSELIRYVEKLVSDFEPYLE